jgi:hypothetical protein
MPSVGKHATLAAAAAALTAALGGLAWVLLRRKRRQPAGDRGAPIGGAARGPGPANWLPPPPSSRHSCPFAKQLHAPLQSPSCG